MDSVVRFWAFALLLVLVLVINLIVVTCQDKDYCAKELCPNGGKHVACENDEKPNERCDNYKPINFTIYEQALILDAHNSLRNKIASGKENGGPDNTTFPTASNMNEIVWDSELAYFASLNVLQCQMAHDQCRGTDIYRYAGQNLANQYSTDPNSIKKYRETINGLIKAWYGEVKDVPLDMISKFYQINDGIKRGHFTQLVWAAVEKIGCAGATFKRGKFPSVILFACDYSVGNILNWSVYETGKPCSECADELGCSERYESLCATKLSKDLSNIIPTSSSEEFSTVPTKPTKKPVPTKKPEKSSQKPSKENKTVPKVPSSTMKPGTTKKPEATTKPITKKNQSTTASPKLTTAKVKPTTPKPKVTTRPTAKPKPTTPKPKPTTKKITPKPTLTSTRRVVNTSKPLTTTAKPKATTKPIKTTTKPVKTTIKPKTTASKRKGTTAKVHPTTVKPKTTTAKPKATTAKPKPTTKKTTIKPKPTTKRILTTKPTVPKKTPTSPPKITTTKPKATTKPIPTPKSKPTPKPKTTTPKKKTTVPPRRTTSRKYHNTTTKIIPKTTGRRLLKPVTENPLFNVTKGRKTSPKLVTAKPIQFHRSSPRVFPSSTLQPEFQIDPRFGDSSKGDRRNGIEYTKNPNNQNLHPTDQELAESNCYFRPACYYTEFGCCPDNFTPARGLFERGCRIPRTCRETFYGCCPDGISPAYGPNMCGCPKSLCTLSLFGCCPDGVTEAKGNDYEGCPR